MKVLGLIMLFAPVGILFGLIAVKDGLKVAIGIVGGTAMLIGWLIIACHLAAR